MTGSQCKDFGVMCSDLFPWFSHKTLTVVQSTENETTDQLFLIISQLKSHLI